VAAAVPERVRWAVETLDVQSGDCVLEIGCGPGVAAALICERLVDGRMLAIDRSPLQIERSRRRNEACLASGRLSLEAVGLAELDAGEERFDKVFAIDVNVFWLGPAKEELAAVGKALAPGGGLFLFYAPPGPERARRAVEGVTAALQAAGFAAPEVVATSPTLVCCVSCLPP
jgi:cyclopropane fatty-acyl-phospholipid synthase-like methyltransferase